MGQKVAVARAAQMLGVNRSILQQLIYDGELKTFEGMLDLEALEHYFPMMTLGADQEYERTHLIRASAFARRVSSTVAPDHDSLENRLRKADSERSIWRARAQHYSGVLQDLGRVLTELHVEASQEQKEVLSTLSCWLKQRLEQ